MKSRLDERRGYTIDELRRKSQAVLKSLGIEMSETNILIMFDKLVDVINLTKSGVVMRDMGSVDKDTKYYKLTESDLRRIVKRVIDGK
jgi:hypothetical protein